MMIGSKLRELRIKKGYTQSQVADKLDCSKSSISMYENNKREPNLQMLFQLLELYGAPIGSLQDKDE